MVAGEGLGPFTGLSSLVFCAAMGSFLCSDAFHATILHVEDNGLNST